jgi:hypothetical protein
MFSPAATLIFYSSYIIVARECADRNATTQQFFLCPSGESQSFAMYCDAAYSLSEHFHAPARVDKAIRDAALTRQICPGVTADVSDDRWKGFD